MVAIILIIAAIAIPNLLRARMAANESSAVASVRTITTGEVTYQTAIRQSAMLGLDEPGRRVGRGLRSQLDDFLLDRRRAFQQR